VLTWRLVSFADSFQPTLTGDGEIESFFGSRRALTTFNTGSTPEKAGGQQIGGGAKSKQHGNRHALKQA
jgi:hypothetical protein